MPTRSEELIQTLTIRVDALPDPQPPFDLIVGWSADYDKLFAGIFDKKTAIAEVLDESLASGRVLLTGRGGGAKSVILSRLAKAALAQGSLPVLVTLKEWTAPDYLDWNALSTSNERMAFLFERFGIVSMHPRDLDVIGPDVLRVVLVDGLNEVDSRVGQQVIYALDDYARFSLNTVVIVADRMSRRDFISPLRWQLSIVLPLSPQQVLSVVSHDATAKAVYEAAPQSAKTLLATPYFLNLFLKEKTLATSIASQVREYFERHALSDVQINRAAEAAFQVYSDATRTFKIASFRARAGHEVTDGLVTAGAIVVDGELAYFDHHLKHDYLASRYVVMDTARWTSDVFNIVTFHASSFETVMMAMEQVPDSAAADQFLRSLYDWNIYAAGYSIAEGRESRVSAEMRFVILAMFAERRWDLVKATAQRARDTLSLIDTQTAKQFLNAVSLEAVFQLLHAVEISTPWFTSWRALFTRTPALAATDQELQSLADPDSVMGWTSANVLKRLHCSEPQQASVRGLMENTSETVQWRAAHVLGSFPSEANSAALIAKLSTTLIHVRFGATRSLVEMAAKSQPNLSEVIFSAIRDHMAAIKEHGSVLNEFERAIFIDEAKAPASWAHFVAIAVLRIQAEVETVEEREHWDRVLANLVSTYGM